MPRPWMSTMCEPPVFAAVSTGTPRCGGPRAGPEETAAASIDAPPGADFGGGSVVPKE